MTATTIDESGATSSGSPQLVQKDGVACVELDNDAKHYDWSSLDIGPTAMPTLTLDITFFATAALGYGWLLGDENGGCDRTVLLNDHPRIGAGKTGGSCMSSNWGTPAINWGQWNRMSVYWDQNTQTAFAVVNGVKGNVVTGLSHNAGYGRLRLGAAWGGHESNVCVSSFRVYDRAPTAAEIAAGALAGPPPVQRFHCREGANGQCYSASISCFGSCASMANWKAPTYTGDYAGFQAFCSSWAANGGVFNGGQGECPKQHLNGKTDRITMAGFTNADLTPSLTIAFKATQISIARNFERVFDFDNGCGINSFFVDVYTTLGGTLQVYGVGSLTIPSGFFELGVEHTYAFTVGAGRASAYRDGVLKAQAVVGGIPSSARSNFFIGGSSCDCDQDVCSSAVQRWHADLSWFGLWQRGDYSVAQIAGLQDNLSTAKYQYVPP
jgi:hypothetical protein